jgi:FkbM family methyltransferase
MNSTTVIFFRTLLRKLGVLSILRSTIFRPENNYEERFNKALLDSISPGDQVWDVGANVGYYTKQFIDRVHPDGGVVAFEPIPSCFQELTLRLSEDVLNKKVSLYNVGLGETDGYVEFQISEDPTSPTNRVVESSISAGDKHIELPVHSGDSLLKKDGLKIPTLVKIDVEGYEEEVIKGISDILTSEDCKHIFIEIHFSILESRGKGYAPKLIVSILEKNDFNVKWVDASHIHAFK